MTFEDFGAVGDGIINDRNAIYDALNSGNAIVSEKGKVYYIGSSIEITGKDITISGSPMFLFKDTSSVKFNGTAGVESVLSAHTLINDGYFDVVSSTGFAVGNIVSITTSEANSWPYDTGYRNGELHKITNIIGNRIFIDDKIWTNWVVGVHTIKVRQFKPITVLINGLIIKYETPQDTPGGLVISYAKDNVLDRTVMHDARNIGIMFHYCYNNSVNYATVNGANHIDNGYGLRFQSSSKSRVTKSNFYRNFKAIESSSSPPTAYDYGQFPNRNLTVTTSYGCGCGLASDGIELWLKGNRFVNTHASSQNVIVDNNIIENCYHSVLTGGSDLTFTNNNISGTSFHVVALYYGKNHLIRGNTVTGTIGDNGGSFVLMQDLHPEGGVIIDNNDVGACQEYAFVLGGTLDANSVEITNNTISFADSLCYKYADKSRLAGLVESNNTWIGNNLQETKD